MRSVYLFFSVLMLLFVLPQHAAAGEKEEAGIFVNELGKQALAVISDKDKSAVEKNSALEKLFVDNVDIGWRGRYVVGRAWRTATEDQKKKYMENYRKFIVSHYTSNFSDFKNANFDVTRIVPDESGGNTVTMRIKRPQAEDIVVNYSIRRDGAGVFKVYDISVEGVSMITTQRSDFTSVISQNGFDYLITQLGKRSQMEKQSDKS